MSGADPAFQAALSGSHCSVPGSGACNNFTAIAGSADVPERLFGDIDFQISGYNGETFRQFRRASAYSRQKEKEK